MADDNETPKWGVNWLLSPTGMSQVGQLIILLIALVKAFQNGEKADKAKDAADDARGHAAVTATRIEDVKKDVQEVRVDVEQVNKNQQKVLMNQLKPKKGD
jgi:uncharacterized protein YPO0396